MDAVAMETVDVDAKVFPHDGAMLLDDMRTLKKRKRSDGFNIGK